jgi:hypothetical protein
MTALQKFHDAVNPRDRRLRVTRSLAVAISTERP